jgi:hypothetical protein
VLRFIVLAALAILAVRTITGRWPWDYLSGAPRFSAEDARRLLDVPRSADRAQIVAAHRRLIARVHPDKGGSAAQVHEADAARDLLLARLPASPNNPDHPS